MAKRLSVKNRKMKRDKASAYKKGELTEYSQHKVGLERSKKALFRKNNRMT